MADRIHLLSEVVANQIAAGEVIERPASVVKELVENALDAQATRVEIDIKRGGKTFICVSDNGIGMSRRDALLCLERHATSKVKRAEDLLSIRSYGFRGEALPSIASVCDFRLRTCEQGADLGTEIVVQGGKIAEVKEAEAIPGTTVEVRSLFSNLPARRKFLRSDGTEWSHIEQLIKIIALSRLDLHLTVHHQVLVHRLAAATNLGERICAIFGKEWWEQMKTVEFEDDAMSVRGAVGGVGVSRADRLEQFIFINGRPVQNSALNFALLEGYGQGLARGRYPVAVLFLEIPPQKVDVNVHPAKREVRFHDPTAVRQMVSKAVSRALRESTRPSFSSAGQADSILSSIAVEPNQPQEESTSLAEASEQETSRLFMPLSRSRPVVPTQMPATLGSEPFAGALELMRGNLSGASFEESSQHLLKILGPFLDRYIAAEHPQGLVLIDQRAAHERVLFERFVKNQEEQMSQVLLLPITFELNSAQSDFLRHHFPLFVRLGIGLGELGKTTWIVDALPAQLTQVDTKEFFSALLMDLEEGQAPLSAYRKFTDQMIIEKICRRAVQCYRRLSDEEIRQLLTDLHACDSPYIDPAGRPTMVFFSRSELEKKFGRSGFIQ